MTDTRQHWIFLLSCGCPTALAEKNRHCRDEDKAWREIYPTRAEERGAAQRGVRVELVDHDTYVRDYFDLMLAGCQHGEGR